MGMGSNKLRLLFCSNGTNTYDPLFLNRFNEEFEIYLATFLHPNEIFRADPEVIQLPDFGKPFRHRKINNLRIAIATLWRALQVRRCIDATNPDIIVGSWVTSFGLYVKLSNRRPFILFAYGSDIVVDPHRSPLHRAISIQVVKSADLVLVDSEVQRRALLSLGCSRERIISFAWFDEGRLRTVYSDRTLRDKLGWGENTIVVCVRKHEPTYSVETVIRAIPIVLNQAPKVRFLIFGSGTQTLQLKQLVHDLRIESYVHFAGNVQRDQLLRYMKDCDIYVSASITDGTSSSLLEAMSLGVPVVVTSIDANSEWIRNGIDGLMFPVYDTTLLAKEIVDLEKNPRKREQLRHAATLVIERRVNWKSSSNELVNRMSSLV